MYRVDAHGNVTIDDPAEVSSFFDYVSSNSEASVDDMFNYMKADNGFSWELDPITVTGSMRSFERGDWMGGFWGCSCRSPTRRIWSIWVE